MVIPLPVTSAWLMVRLLLPEFVSVTACELLLPTLTLPKEMLVGCGVNCPGAGATAFPLPWMFTFLGEPGALFMIEMMPFTSPAAVGANRTVKLWL